MLNNIPETNLYKKKESQDTEKLKNWETVSTKMSLCPSLGLETNYIRAKQQMQMLV